MKEEEPRAGIDFDRDVVHEGLGAQALKTPTSDMPRERSVSVSDCWIVNMRDSVGLTSTAC